MRRPFLILSLTLVGADLRAQYPATDSAAVARQQWRGAAEALRAGDTTRAFAALTRAATAWPVQPAYSGALARLAASTGRADAALTALAQLNALGSGWTPTDPSFGRLTTDPRFQRAVHDMEAATATMERSRIAWTVADPTLRAEGVAVDSATGRWFLSSLRHRKVVVREQNGDVRDFVTPAQDGLDGVYGMAVDRRRGVLWVASSANEEQIGYAPTDEGRSALFAFDLQTGALKAKVTLPPINGGHLLGDVIVTPRGTLFASDSRYPALYRIPVGALPGIAEVVVERHPLFRSLQGMEPSADERFLFLADYSHGLLRVDLASREVTTVLAPAGVTLLGIDGMAGDGTGGLIAVQNGIAPVRVIRLQLDREERVVERLTVLDRPPFGDGEATLGVRVGASFVYVATAPASLRILDLTLR
jgi:hypothetical protein